MPDVPNPAAAPEAAPDKSKNVAVVGGSAAGLFTATLLARRGASVRVFECSPALDPAIRTLIVTSHMRSLLGPASTHCVLNEIRRFELFTDGRVATVELRDPDLIIERRALIQLLAEQARGAGVSVEVGRRFHGLRANEEGEVVLDIGCGEGGAREQANAGTVVGADGALSRVARSAGWPAPLTVPLLQAIVRLPKGMAKDTTRVWFVPEDTPYFYWLIPESAERGALGVIGENGAETRRHFESFMERKGFKPIEYQGARIPVYTGWVPVRKQVGKGSVYLVGDAAAQVKVTTVGGIVTGLRGALGVAEAILNGGKSRELRALRRELDAHLWLRRSLHHFKQQDYSMLVDLLHDSAKQSLAGSSRDEAWKLLWRVCAKQPKLVLLGLRGLITRNRTFGRSD